jgi:hypothetical protein
MQNLMAHNLPYEFRMYILAMSNVSNVQTYAYTAETGIIPYTSVPDLLKQAAIEYPDRNACISCTVNRERTFITFSELYTKSELSTSGLENFQLF